MANAENSARKITYFPFDINTFHERRVKNLMRKCGLHGPMVYVMLLCSVFEDDSIYCTRADDGVVPDIAEYCGLTNEDVAAIIADAVDCGLFDRVCYESYGVLTSKRIQQKFQEMVRPRKNRTRSDVDKRLWLLTEAETDSHIRVLGGKASRTEVSEAFDFHEAEDKSNENEIKENKNKEKENIIKEKETEALTADCRLVISEYEKYIGRASPNVIREIGELMEQGAEAELIVRLIHYALEVQKCSWSYIKAAVKGNLSVGITTVRAYEESREARALQRRSGQVTPRSRFNNYEDKNKPDYSDFGQRIIAEMLAECGDKPDEEAQ